MCYYRLFIFLGCGHSTFSSTPVRYCADARTKAVTVERNTGKSPEDEGSSGQSAAPSATSSANAPTHTLPVRTARKDLEECDASSATAAATEDDVQPCTEGRAHPFHSVRLERICAICEYEREERLRALESSVSEIRFEPWRWQGKFRGGRNGPPAKGTSFIHGQDVRASVLSMSAAVGTWMKDWNRKDSGMAP
ncbi:uncharacterized protein K460DRAFT_371983 [Cucurbitaria berberidis CBS 394.84]|uniref:Uncharacterized protein n=1 Tax=Cucurbitaria berberidis CBS 394.84 TaxID=1168544 RepID=A0A9P4G6N8_9PLEO|nr:uncharacterized protein K460DRAFT_371983 [Cucurbitaria berberidis CBS 394.84]KAF1840017.1 hypothetical protein K460DRAFT_371983 [Cucurbitaria berberidis CBS 394.84]